MRRLLLHTGTPGRARELGLLILRLVFGASLIGAHGWGKLTHFAERADRFADPLGLGSEASLGLAVFAEVFCGLALILGIGGRLASVALVVFFVVAFFVIHGGDPFAERELAFLYLGAFAALALTGPGRYSIAGQMRRR